MKRIKQLGIGIILSMQNAMISYASNDYRLDKKLLAGILEFFVYCSYLVFAIGLGLLFYSIKNEDGSRKLDALKMIGFSVALFCLKGIAISTGFIT